MWLVLAAIQIIFFNVMYFLQGNRNLNNEFKIICISNLVEPMFLSLITCFLILLLLNKLG